MGSLIKELLRLDAFNLPVVDQLLIWLLTRAADVRVWHFASAPKVQDSRPVLERQPQAGDGFLWRAPRTNAPGACGGPQLVSIGPRGDPEIYQGPAFRTSSARSRSHRIRCFMSSSPMRTMARNGSYSDST